MFGRAVHFIFDIFDNDRVLLKSLNALTRTETCALIFTFCFFQSAFIFLIFIQFCNLCCTLERISTFDYVCVYHRLSIGGQCSARKICSRSLTLIKLLKSWGIPSACDLILSEFSTNARDEYAAERFRRHVDSKCSPWCSSSLDLRLAALLWSLSKIWSKLTSDPFIVCPSFKPVRWYSCASLLWSSNISTDKKLSSFSPLLWSWSRVFLNRFEISENVNCCLSYTSTENCTFQVTLSAVEIRCWHVELRKRLLGWRANKIVILENFTRLLDWFKKRRNSALLKSRWPPVAMQVYFSRLIKMNGAHINKSHFVPIPKKIEYR